MLSVHNLHKSYGSLEVLRGIDFQVDKGEVVAVLGPSGSGKTTLLRCISFLEKADSGTIGYDDQVLDMTSATPRQVRELRMQMGFVFQSFNLFSNMTALRNVTEGLTVARGMDKAEAEAIAWKMLQKVGMEDRAGYYPHQLSGGQQQRVAIARALSCSPRVVLFDEPTSALDPELTGEVLDVMRNLAQEGTTMVVVTHEMGFAREAAGRIVLMEEGTVVENTPAKEFFTQPKTSRGEQFLHKRK